jgi:hypothetical protein
MKNKIICFFTCCLFLLYFLNARTKNNVSSLTVPAIPEPPAEIQAAPKNAKIDKDIIYNQIQQLINGNSIPPIIDILKNDAISLKDFKDIVQTIVDDEGFSGYFKTVLLFALASSIKTDNMQKFFFDLIPEPKTKKGEPVVWAAAEIDASLAGIPDFVQYVATTPGKEKFARATQEAVERTIDEDDTDTLEDLVPYIKLTPADADTFLWKVAKDNRDAQFIGILKKLGARIDAVLPITDNGKTRKQTPLMYVADHITNANRSNLVKEFLQAGADPDFSPEGNDIDARSIAREKGISGMQKAFDAKSLGESAYKELRRVK